MAQLPTPCPKCRGVMSAGFLLDRGHGNSLKPTSWQDGLPEISFWMGLKTSGHQQIPVTVYRCASCGFLESYAHTPVS